LLVWAFFRSPPLLLLDEPTAHLDAITAAQVLATVETLMAHRTVILVSHGPGWAGPAGQTITLHHGKRAGPDPRKAAAAPGQALAAAP
jgi:ABC-type transport system involved in cytochrome bd biosynthesis fused ATPase/permease subunit